MQRTSRVYLRYFSSLSVIWLGGGSAFFLVDFLKAKQKVGLHAFSLSIMGKAFDLKAYAIIK